MRLEVLSLAGPAWIQDGGRPGRQHEGVPAGGAWVPEGLARVNRAVGNPPESAAIEAAGPLTLRAIGPIVLGVGGAPVWLESGATYRWPGPAPWRVGYVAVRGGIDIAPVLGGRGALPILDAPDLPLRGLRVGDCLGVGTKSGAPRLRAGEWRPCLLDVEAAIRVVGHRAPALVNALADTRWRLAPHGDRTGLPLEPDGDRTVWDRVVRAASLTGEGPSVPMGPGAIQLPPGGRPVVLGPDHPTTGGYPVIGWVLLADLGSLAARPPGATVWFTEVGPMVARVAHERWIGELGER